MIMHLRKNSLQLRSWIKNHVDKIIRKNVQAHFSVDWHCLLGLPIDAKHALHNTNTSTY